MTETLPLTATKPDQKTACPRCRRIFRPVQRPTAPDATADLSATSLDSPPVTMRCTDPACGLIVRASQRDLEAINGVGAVRAREIREGLRRLQEHNLVDRYLQL